MHNSNKIYKTKKVLIILIMALFTVLLISCNLYKKNEQFEALKTEAVYSAYGFPGFPTDSLSIKETDEFGRILYLFNGINNAGFYESGSSFLLICQYINYEDEYVYFYPEINIIILESLNYSDSDINQLKEKNDWNNELNLAKCIKKKIGTYKINTEQERIRNIVYKYFPTEVKYNEKIFLHDIDKNGVEIYAVKLWQPEMEDICFIVITNEFDYIIERVYERDNSEQIKRLRNMFEWQWDYCINE